MKKLKTTIEIKASDKHCAVYTDEVHFCCRFHDDDMKNECMLFKRKLKVRVTKYYGYTANVFIYRCRKCIEGEI